MTLLRLGFATVMIAAMLGTASASAGTISDRVVTLLGGQFTQYWFTAGEGETNTLDVMDFADGLTVRDTTAPLLAEGQCTAADGAARCPADIVVLRAVLGDGDDRFVTDSDVWMEIDAGAGADVVSTGDGWDSIDGGEGDDQLDAGGGEAPGLPDTGDEVGYAGRTTAVVVDLTAGIGGAAGERDLLSGFESAVGGSGDDRLTGSAKANTLSGRRGDDVLLGLGNRDVLWGGGGDDTIRGGAGRDEIYGGAGSDRLEGGSGNDRIRADDGPRDADVIDCGPGKRDVVWIDPRADRVRNCERVVRN
jgi:Ca2+-binding RTX toxin-like protein